MSELIVYFGGKHSNPKNLNDYLGIFGSKAESVWFEIKTYHKIKEDLEKADSLDAFLDQYFKNMSPRTRAWPSFFSVLEYIKDNSLDLWAIGDNEKEMKSNVELIISENNFKGVHLFIIGAGLRDFFESDLKPILSKKFKVSNYKPNPNSLPPESYKSSSCPSCSK